MKIILREVEYEAFCWGYKAEEALKKWEPPFDLLNPVPDWVLKNIVHPKKKDYNPDEIFTTNKSIVFQKQGEKSGFFLYKGLDLFERIPTGDYIVKMDDDNFKIFDKDTFDFIYQVLDYRN